MGSKRENWWNRSNNRRGRGSSRGDSRYAISSQTADFARDLRNENKDLWEWAREEGMFGGGTRQTKRPGKAGLWSEVKDRLTTSDLGLCGGHQQRLCIARALAVEPDVLLMDEPCSALDPIATGKIEELLFTLKNTLTIIIVTHNMQQAARISDYTGFLLMGERVEFGETIKIFTVPNDSRTEDYITGRFG